MKSLITISALLVVASLALLACGEEDRSSLLPGNTAAEIRENLSTIRELNDSGQCLDATTQSTVVEDQVRALGPEVDEELRANLLQGVMQLQRLIQTECVTTSETPVTTSESPVPDTDTETETTEPDEDPDGGRGGRQRQPQSGGGQQGQGNQGNQGGQGNQGAGPGGNQGGQGNQGAGPGGTQGGQGNQGGGQGQTGGETPTTPTTPTTPPTTPGPGSGGVSPGGTTPTPGTG